VNEYLGSKITEDGRSCSTREITSRIHQAELSEYAFRSKKNMFTFRNVYINVRKNLLNAYVFSIAWYGIKALGKKEKK